MSEINDGGSAFPDDDCQHAGMSLRDYFAAAALTGILKIPVNPKGIKLPRYYAVCAYEQADAMLIARNSTTKE